MQVSRRMFLKKMLVGGAAAVAMPWFAVSPAHCKACVSDVSGRLAVYNAHTDESLQIRYMTPDGNLIPHALERLNRLFRCHHNHAVKEIDPSLFVLMDRIHTRLGAGRRPLRLISGYRSPEYNEFLRSRGSRVAKKSYHLKGMAADIHIKGVKLAKLREVAGQINGGGVGSYSQFIHVDVGPVRSW